MDVPTPIRTEALLAEAGTVSRLARTLVRRSDLAHDVAQDVMLIALRQPHAPGNLRGWLAAVTRHLAGKAVRSQRVRAAVEGAAAQSPDGDDAARTAERLRVHRRLTDAVLALPEPYRTAVTLRFFDDLPPRAIAQRLGMSSEVVRKRLQRGLEMLRERLDGEFGDRAGWARAFAAVGLVEMGTPWLLITVLAMNKLALAAAATLAVGVWWLWSSSTLVPHPVENTMTRTESSAASGKTAHEIVFEPRDESSRRELAVLTERGCRIDVVDAAGRPIRGAHVQCWRDGSMHFLRGTTGHDGACSFAAEGAGGVLVFAEGHYPHHATWSELRGAHRLVLPDGQAIEGCLFVDGRPGEGTSISLETWVPPPCVPAQMTRQWPRVADTTCGPNGRFRFVGLPTDWRGSLRLPQALWLLPESGGTEEAHERMAVRAGQDRLVVSTTLLPHVMIRVVWADDGTRVEAADVSAVGHFVDGTNSPGLGASTDGNGEVRLGFAAIEPGEFLRWCRPEGRRRLDRVDVSVSATGSQGKVQQTLRIRDGKDGEPFLIGVPRAARRHFLATDVRGMPVAGAIVQTQGLSVPTDADGRGVFAETDGTEVLIGAPGHRVGFCRPMRAASGSETDPLVYELLSDNSVQVKCIDQEGRPVRVRGEIRCAISFFAGERIARDIDRVLYAAGSGSGRPVEPGSLHWRDYKHAFGLDVNGTATLHSLEPGLRCDVTLRDSFWNEIGSTSFVTPAFGDHEAVTIRVEGTAFRFVGRVTDPVGKPIVAATVALGSYMSSGTNVEGDFSLSGFSRDPNATVSVKAPGFVAQTHEEVLLRDGAKPRLFPLARAFAVTVRVLDEAGAAQPLRPNLESPRLHDVYEVLDEGCIRWTCLPESVVTFSCRMGGRTFSVQHDTRQPEAILRVPVPGRLRVVVTGGWPEPSGPRSWVRAVVRPLDEPPRDPALPLPLRGTTGAATFSSDDVEPQLLPPGSYRIVLIESTRVDSDVFERTLGLAVEVTVRAGEEATATLR